MKLSVINCADPYHNQWGLQLR